MIYRMLDENHDMKFGRSNQDFLEDSTGNPEAIAQAIKTRLLLFKGEWWMDLNDGLPLWQQILGQRIVNKGIIDRIISDRIRKLRLPDNKYGILSVFNILSQYESEQDRQYSFSCSVDTIFGILYITNAEQEGGGEL